MLITYYNRNDYNIDNINEFNVLDYNIKQKLGDKINFDNKYSRTILLTKITAAQNTFFIFFFKFCICQAKIYWHC